MNRIDEHSLGLSAARFLTLWAVVWSILVWLGVAQGVMDLLFQLHMIHPAYQVVPFRFNSAAALVSVAMCLGYASGVLMGLILNRSNGQSVRFPSRCAKTHQLHAVHSMPRTSSARS